MNKAYKLYDPIKRETFVSRDVIFDENASWKLAQFSDLDVSSSTSIKAQVPGSIEDVTIEELEEEDEEHQTALRRSTRDRRQPQRLTYHRGNKSDFEQCNFAFLTLVYSMMNLLHIRMHVVKRNGWMPWIRR